VYDVNKQEADIRRNQSPSDRIIKLIAYRSHVIDERGGNSGVDLRHVTAARIITVLYPSLYSVKREILYYSHNDRLSEKSRPTAAHHAGHLYNDNAHTTSFHYECGDKNIYTVGHKKKPTYFVCNFVKYQRILMQLSLLDFKINGT